MVGVTTIFCRDKFNQQARCGIKLGQAYDLRTGYNINGPKVKDEIRRCIWTGEPDLVVGSPKCGPFSQINDINDQAAEAAIAKKKMVIEHLKFTFECCAIQMQESNKYVLFEHPRASKPWKRYIINEAEARLGMKIYRCDQCYFATQEHTDRHGTSGLIKKPTGFMTNCRKVGDNLSKTGMACHEHVDVFGDLSQKSQACSVHLVRAVLSGLKNALRNKGPKPGLSGGKGGLRGVSKPPPGHYIIHFPKHEGCEVCRNSKAQASPHPRRK